MSTPKSHHYVPRFYLSKFADPKGRVWVFDKATAKTFQASVESIACSNHFYRLPELEADGLDPNLLELQFGKVESRAASILNGWLSQVNPGAKLAISSEDRRAFSLFVILQMLRTIEARTVLIEFLRFATAGDPKAPQVPDTEAGQKSLHASALWDDDHVQKLVQRVFDRVWLFGLNGSPTSFLTSDGPALLKDGAHRGFVVNTFVLSFLDEMISDPRDYIVFPLSPKVVLYCHDRELSPGFDRLDNAVTPVVFTSDMVQHENSGQIGMSSRFVYSADGDFDFVRQYIKDQPWVAVPGRERFAQRVNPYETD